MALQHPQTFTTFQRFTDLSSETVPANILISFVGQEGVFQTDQFFWGRRNSGSVEFWLVDDYHYANVRLFKQDISQDRQTLTLTSLDEHGNDLRFLVHNEAAIAQLFKSNIKQVWEMLSAMDANQASDEEIEEEQDELFRLMKTFQRNNIIATFPEILNNELSRSFILARSIADYGHEESAPNHLFSITNGYSHILFRDTDSWYDFTALRFSNGNTFHTPRQLERFHEEVIRRLKAEEITDQSVITPEWFVTNIVWAVPEGRSNGVLLYPSLAPQLEVELIAEENDVCFANITHWNFFGGELTPRIEWYLDDVLQSETSERFSFTQASGRLRCVVKETDCLGHERTASAENYKIA